MNEKNKKKREKDSDSGSKTIPMVPISARIETQNDPYRRKSQIKYATTSTNQNECLCKI